MLTLNDIIINQNTYKEILVASYYGTNFQEDSRKLSRFRSDLDKYNNYRPQQKHKMLNDLIVLFNVFDVEQLSRFLLSNKPEHTLLLFCYFYSTERLLPIYYNINGTDLDTFKIINTEDFSVLYNELQGNIGL